MRRTLGGSVEVLRLCWQVDRPRLLAAAGLMLAHGCSFPLVALALGAMTNAVVDGNGTAAMVNAGLAATLTITALTCGHFAHVWYFELGELSVLALDRRLIAVSNGSSGIDHHEQPDYADRLQVLRDELPRIGGSSMTALMLGLSLLAGTGLTGLFLGRLDPWLLLLPLGALPPLVAGRWAEAHRGAARQWAAEPTRRARYLLRLATHAGPAKELRVCGLSDEIRNRQRGDWNAATGLLRRAEVRAAAVRAAGQLAYSVIHLGALVIVVRESIGGRNAPGDLVVAVVLAAQLSQQVNALLSLVEELQRTAQALDMLGWASQLVGGATPHPGLPGTPTGPVAAHPVDPGDVEPPDRIERGIRLRGLTFRYPRSDVAVLADVDAWLPAGSTVAVVGDNGAGKSTLIKLLCRLYESSDGAIELDGVDIRRIPVQRWRQSLAAGFQDFVRFELLAQESIGIGDLPRVGSSEAVLAAVDRAGAVDTVGRLEHGLQTRLGTAGADGSQLSGGQWQQLALSRAMMRPAPLLLVLDEPAAGLDAQAEHRLFERYSANAARLRDRSGTITLLVSHRFSTVRTADLILVMSGGRIVERGDHDELMAAGGVYAELYGLHRAAYR